MFSLGDGALDVLAAITIDAGNGDLKALDHGGQMDLNLGRILVADHLSIKLQLLALVDDTGGDTVGALGDV